MCPVRFVTYVSGRSKPIENKSFSRAFCCLDFAVKFRSWKRQEERRSVLSAVLRGRNDSIVIVGPLRAPPSTAPFDRGRAENTSRHCRAGKRTNARKCSRFESLTIRARGDIGGWARLRAEPVAANSDAPCCAFNFRSSPYSLLDRAIDPPSPGRPAPIELAHFCQAAQRSRSPA